MCVCVCVYDVTCVCVYIYIYDVMILVCVYIYIYIYIYIRPIAAPPVPPRAFGSVLRAAAGCLVITRRLVFTRAAPPAPPSALPPAPVLRAAAGMIPRRSRPLHYILYFFIYILYFFF